MRFLCLSSSSKGNGYLLTSSKGETLIIECGVSVKEVKKALNFDLSGVVGAFISHLHGDHSNKMDEYLSAGIDTYLEMENQDRLIAKKNHRLKFYRQLKDIQIGSFKIKAFPVVHDLPTVGFLISHPEMGRMVFITDTKFCQYNIAGLQHIFVEANYSEKIIYDRLLSGSLNGFLRNRIQESHMSFETAKELLLANDLSQVRTICLLHLSDGNADANRFKRETEELTGKPTFIADTGTEIDLSLNPF